MAAMADLRQDGFINHAGVSNFSVRRLKHAQAASDIPIVANQVQCHPFAPKNALRQYCREQDILLTAYSPLGHGGVLNDPVLQTIGEKYGKTAAQVAIKWAISHDHVAAIPKATTADHQRENLDVFDFDLTPREIAHIERPSILRTALSVIRGRIGL
jgi:diketogulonate reductase-like aldo/keto reductase